jgi:hypothetical protein
MPNILIADGTPAAWQAERAVFDIPSNFSLFAAAVQLHRPDARCTPLNIADGEPLPRGTMLADFDGVMFTGSPLHIYDPTASVTGQIDFARAVPSSSAFMPGVATSSSPALTTRVAPYEPAGESRLLPPPPRYRHCRRQREIAVDWQDRNQRRHYPGLSLRGWLEMN